MFDSIAPAYDFMNTAMTFGLHRRWRDKALKAAVELLNQSVNTSSGLRDDVSEILDVATGTGDGAFPSSRNAS